MSNGNETSARITTQVDERYWLRGELTTAINDYANGKVVWVDPS